MTSNRKIEFCRSIFLASLICVGINFGFVAYVIIFNKWRLLELDTSL
ncbi:MAG: hypothetical protein IKI22_02305 [Neisseriaceae bacterium]|nr:hypothetical protein [Neisseriaceae bacterium]